MENREKLRNFDLWAVSKDLRKKIPIDAANTWIKTYQDEGDTPIEDLTPAALININVDKLAGDHQQRVQGTGPVTVPHYGPEHISIFLRDEKVTFDIRKTIDNYYNGKQMRCYIIRKFKWTGENFNLVHWDALEGAMNSHFPSQLTNITKFAYRWQTVRLRRCNSTMQRNCQLSTTKNICALCAALIWKPPIMSCNAITNEL